VCVIQADDGSTPLHRSSDGVHVGLARFLVEHGADVVARDKQGFTPLHSLSSTGNVDFLSFLNLADNVAARHTDPNSLRFEPSKNAAHVDLAKFLVEHGADVASQDKHGSTPSHLASKNRHVELALFLVEHSTVTTAHATLQTDQSTKI